MRHVLAVSILAASIPAWAVQPITFAARDDGFAVSSTASGIAHKDGPFLAVSLAQHTLRQGTQFRTPTKVFEYRVGLARNDAHGRWVVERWSDTLSASFTLSPGDTKQLPSTTALIPIDNLQSLRDSWLVVQVKVQRDGTVGTTYSHSNKLVLD